MYHEASYIEMDVCLASHSYIEMDVCLASVTLRWTYAWHPREIHTARADTEEHHETSVIGTSMYHETSYIEHHETSDIE